MCVLLWQCSWEKMKSLWKEEENFRMPCLLFIAVQQDSALIQTHCSGVLMSYLRLVSFYIYCSVWNMHFVFSPNVLHIKNHSTDWRCFKLTSAFLASCCMHLNIQISGWCLNSEEKLMWVIQPRRMHSRFPALFWSVLKASFCALCSSTGILHMTVDSQPILTPILSVIYVLSRSHMTQSGRRNTFWCQAKIQK